MRGIHAKLGLAALWLVIAMAPLAGGCSSAPDSATNMPPGTGKTITPPPDPHAAERAAGMAKSGQAMAADQAKAAQEMAAARARAGGK
jgi:hypothetical protein